MISHILSCCLHQKIVKFSTVVGRGKSQLRKNKSIDKTEISLYFPFWIWTVIKCISYRIYLLQHISSFTITSSVTTPSCPGSSVLLHGTPFLTWLSSVMVHCCKGMWGRWWQIGQPVQHYSKVVFVFV